MKVSPRPNYWGFLLCVFVPLSLCVKNDLAISSSLGILAICFSYLSCGSMVFVFSADYRLQTNDQPTNLLQFALSEQMEQM